MPTLKKVLYKNPSFKFWFIFLIICSLVLTMLVVNKVSQVKGDKAFIASTIPANATVTKKFSSRSIEYEYSTRNGDIIKSKINTKPSYIRTINPKDTITIFYDPYNPRESFLPQELKVEYFDGIPLIVFIFIVFVLGPAIAVMKIVKQAKVVVELFKSGSKAKAKIYEIRVTSQVSDKAHSATINYYFHDKQGQQKKGESKNTYFKDVAHFIKPDSGMLYNSNFLPIPETELIDNPVINILYNPDNPNENVWMDQYG